MRLAPLRRMGATTAPHEPVDTLGDTQPGAFDDAPLCDTHPAMAQARQDLAFTRRHWLAMLLAGVASVAASALWPWGFLGPLP